MKPWIPSFLLGLLTGVAVAVGLFWFDMSGQARASRGQVIGIYHAVNIGDSAGEAAQAVLKQLHGAGFYAAETSPVTRWYVSERTDFFQRHWVLVICIEQGKVTGKRFGTGDDVAVKPQDAPSSVGACVPK